MQAPSHLGLLFVSRACAVTYLAIVLKPLGGDPGDGVVLRGRALGHTSEAHRSSSLHRGQDVVVDWLVQANRFLCNGQCE